MLVLIILKDKFTQKFKFSHYLLTLMQMEHHSKTALEHSPKQLKLVGSCFKMLKKSNQNRNLYWLLAACLAESNSPEAVRSPIDLKRHYIHPRHTVEHVYPLQTGCVPTLLA